MSTADSGMTIFNISGTTDTIPPMPINWYSTMSIPAYRRAMALLSETLAGFPRSVRKDGAKLDGPHRLDTLLKRRPNGYQNPFVFYRTVIFHACRTMNGYAWIERDGVTSDPIALHNRRPELIFPFRFDSGDGLGLQQYYLDRGCGEILPGVDMIHLQGLSWDGQCGTDPAFQNASTFQQAATLQRYIVKFWSKGTMIRGAIETEQKMTEPQVDEVRRKLKSFVGADGDQDILILHSGGHFNNATTNPQQSQLVEQVASSTKAIAQVTGVPPELLYEQHESKYNNAVDQAGEFFVRFSLTPWINLIQAELTIKLLSEDEQDQGYSIRLNPDALLRGNIAAQADVATKLKAGGVIDANEGRTQFLEMPPRDDPEANRLETVGSTQPTKPATPPEKPA